MSTLVTKLSVIVLSSCILCSGALLAQSAVWQVQHDNNVMYIAGGINFLPASAYPLPAEFTFAYAQSNLLVQALPVQQLMAPASYLLLQQQMQYPASTSLSQHLTATTQQKLQRYLNGAGINWQQLDSFKPGMLMLQMTAMEVRNLHYSADGIAVHFAQKASQDNKPQQYLGSLAEHFSLLAALGQGYEDAFVHSLLKQVADSAKNFQIMLQVWQTADLAQQALLNQKLREQVDLRLYQQLFTERHQAWLPQIESLLATEPASMLLLDMAALAGPDGIIQLLRQQGYQVQPLDLSVTTHLAGNR